MTGGEGQVGPGSAAAPPRATEGFSGVLAEEYGERHDPEGRRLRGVVRANAVKFSARQERPAIAVAGGARGRAGRRATFSFSLPANKAREV